MVWVKLDDQFPDHPKVVAAGPCAAWLHVCGIAYCNRHLTDGFIPRGVAHRLTDFDGLSWTGPRNTDAVAGPIFDVDCEGEASRLVELGLWDEDGGGYRIHDYHDFQPTKAEVEELREKRSAAGRKGGEASAEAKRQARVKQELEQSLKQTASKRSSKIEANFNPVPVPDPEDLSSSPALHVVGPTSKDSGEGLTRMQRLLRATGPHDNPVEAELKFFRALKNATEADVVAAIEATKRPVKTTKLAVALHVLGTRKKERAA